MNNQDDETGHSPAKEVSMLPSNRHDQAKHPFGERSKSVTDFVPAYGFRDFIQSFYFHGSMSGSKVR